MDRHIAIIIASRGYQPIEYAVPKKLFEQEGWKVTTVSNKPGIATASDNSTTQATLSIDKLDIKNYDAIVLVGGPGALEHLDNQITHAIFQKAVQEGKTIGAICISPRILAKSGILQHKKATGWDDDHKLADVFEEFKVTYERQPVVIDGNIVTAVGPHAAREFAMALIHLFYSAKEHHVF